MIKGTNRIFYQPAKWKSLFPVIGRFWLKSMRCFLINLVAEGKIKPVIDRTYPLEKTAEAVNYLSEGHSRGKVVIQVAHGIV
jgi:threonine dehydrogenase-like Zn-dependent dehydrogenase